MLSEIIKLINKNELRVYDYNLLNKLELCFPSYIKGIKFMWHDEDELYVTINDLHIIKCIVKEGVLIAECC